MTQPHTLIIGGGVIGVCAAFFLAERGARVTLVEQGEIAAGSSYGNAGLIVPSHITPLPTPGALTNGLKWMLDPESPFYIKPRLDLDLISWVLKFGAAANERQMQKAIPTIREMGRASSALHDQLAALDLDCGYKQDGLLSLFITPHGMDDGLAEEQLLRANGINAKLLNGDEVRAMEPAARPEVLGGLYTPDDAHFTPDRFVHNLARLAESKGVAIHTQTEVLGFETSGKRVTQVKTTRGDFIFDQMIMAAGSWSPTLVRDLELHIPIQPAKGYSVTVKRPATAPAIPLSLSESRVIATPMISEQGTTLRFAGTLELAGLDFSINRRRVDAIMRAARTYLRGLDDLETVEIWRGLRPCTPDGLPIIGRAQSFDNLIIATGHAMLGMSLGPITGKLVSQIACGEEPEIDIRPLRVERF